MLIKNILNALYAITFVSLLLLPLLFIDIYGGGVSENENRMLAVRPPISYMFLYPRNFFGQFNEWFQDNAGFREDFIGYYAYLKKLENNVRYTEGSYVMLKGEQGHHYFAHSNGFLIDKFQGKPFLTDGQLEGLTGGINRAKGFLDEKGIPLVVMFCVDKEEIYPEYYPKLIMRGPEPTQLEIITRYAKEHTDADVFNIKESLMSAKEDYFVFDKTGDATSTLSHYNEIGAFFAYRELMRHIKTYFPEMEVFTIDDVEITYPNEDEYPNKPNVRLKRELTYEKAGEDFFEGVPLNHPSHGIAFINNDDTLPDILIMRDSYMGNGTYISRYIPQHFGRTILIHWSNMASLKSYVLHFKPDIVVFESAERELGGFSNSVAGIT